MGSLRRHPERHSVGHFATFFNHSVGGIMKAFCGQLCRHFVRAETLTIEPNSKL